MLPTAWTQRGELLPRVGDRLMKILLPVTLILALGGATPVAPAAPVHAFMDVNTLQQYCRGSGSDPNRASDFCQGFTAGAVDQILVRQSKSPKSRWTVCLPADAKLNDLVSIVLIDMGLHPDWNDSTAAGAIEHTLSTVYPCGDGAPSQSLGLGRQSILARPS